MERLRGEFSVTLMSRVLKVSRQGFYARRTRPASAHSKRDAELLELIVASSEGSRGVYGSPRVHADLKELGEPVSRKRVARLMKQEGLSGRVKPRFRAPRAQVAEAAPAPNLLGRWFEQDRPDAAWVSDITYMPTSEGWLFLCVVIDLYSRRIVGWSMSERQDTELVKKALLMALGARAKGRGLLFHSDQGCQFTSREFRRLLEENDITCSMSRRGECWDNACAESFFGTLKQELVNTKAWKTPEELRLAVFEYIEVFYNRKRRHSSLGFVSPAAFEEQVA
jgi:transposase InsO family protein